MSTLQSSLYSPFSISVVPDRSEVAVVAVGELDLDSRDQVAEAVEELWESGFDDIVIDLRQVEFIDSQGLRMLLGLRNDATENGRGVTFVPPEPPARRIFDLTGTGDLFG